MQVPPRNQIKRTNVLTVGTRLFCQRPELFPKDTTRPLYAKPQSEHSLTRDTQWVGGSQPTPYGGRLTRGAGMARSRKPANAGRGHSCTESSSHWFEPAKPNRNPIEHPSTLSPASNTSKEAVTVGTRLFLPKTRVISQRHNQAPNAPAPTWNRQLLRPNHCTAFPTPSQFRQIGAGENPVKNPRGCSSLPLSDGGPTRSAMAPSLTDGTGTPIPAISLTLEPSAHSP